MLASQKASVERARQLANNIRASFPKLARTLDDHADTVAAMTPAQAAKLEQDVADIRRAKAAQAKAIDPVEQTRISDTIADMEMDLRSLERVEQIQSEMGGEA